eukprot:Tamp_22487.p1 GENE.Tamp_22487~~Tamp_22487.p1  ORF type:complete len:320 (-),score=73.08 Tamp_22487:126-1085(-)
MLARRFPAAAQALRRPLRSLVGVRYGSSGEGKADKPEPSAEEIVKIDRQDGIAIVSLNRPTKLNALNMDMFRGILRATKELQQDRDIAAVILRGEGRAFCAGLDFKNVLADPLSFKANFHELMDRDPGGSVANLVQAVGYEWKKVPAPVICVTHGVCFGGGLQIALGADFRYTASDCQFSVMESKWGLVPDMSASVTLRELVPIDVAKELTMTHRIFKGPEAKELGIVTRVCEDPMADALALAKDIASKSPDAVAAAKRLYNKTYALNDRQALELESELQTKLILGWNNVASVAKGFGVPDFLAPKKSKRNEFWHQNLE